MFKKTAIAALILGFSGAASAAMYAPAPAPACSAGNVTVPCEGSAWDLGIDYLHLTNHENVASNILDVNNNGYEAESGSGFRLEGSYHWGTGNDFNINWTHFSKSDDQDMDGADGDTERLESKLTVVNLEVGQHIDVGENWNIRVHGGVQYARVTNHFDQDIATANDAEDWKVKGWGPRAGIDSHYDFGNGFGLFANAAVSILHAELESDFDNPATATFTQQATITATDMRVGAMYTHAMAQGDLSVRGGYQVNNFINAGANGNNAAFLALAGQRDLSFDGWFVGLKWVGNA